MSDSTEPCEVCGGPRCATPTKTLVCIDCVRAGGRFARLWMRDLDASGIPRAETAEIVGVLPTAVGARLSELRRHG